MEKLTIQEEEAMLYIWELGSCFVKDIVAKYPKPAPPYTTVASIVKNLERKQYIRAARVGNTYQYTPLIRESEYKRTFMSGFVRNYFENSYKEMVSFFAKEQKISTKDLKDIIAQRYTANREEVSLDRAHLRKGIIYSSPNARISSYQSLNDEQRLETNKVYAKLAILENEDVLRHVIPHSSNSKLRETIGNAFSSTEVIHYGEIEKKNIIDVSKEVVDLFALIQQIDGIEKNRVEQLKKALLTEVKNGATIPTLPEIEQTLKDNVSIDEMYKITEGTVEYGKAKSIVKNMFYLSKARKNAIELSNILREILGNNSEFEDVIEYIRNNGFRVEPEIISRKSGKGVKLSESVNLNLQREEQTLIEDIKNLSSDELEEVLQNGGLVDIQNIITKTYGKETEKIDISRYYAEAIISKYNWQEIGIEEFKLSEKNELIKRLQEKDCIDIYNKLKEAGITEEQIPTVLLNIETRKGL